MRNALGAVIVVDIEDSIEQQKQKAVEWINILKQNQ